jgi:lysophospholipase L1-like esterase
MLAQAVVLVLVVPYALSSSADLAPQEAAEPAPTASPSSPAEPPPDPVRVLVVGDSYSVGSAEGGVGAANWTAVVTATVEDVTIDVAAEGGRGYVSTGSAGRTFVDLAARAGTGYEVVVVFGSRNDDGPGAEVQQAAEQTFALLTEGSPEAELLVIGPPWVDGAPPDHVRAASRAVQAAARAAGATFVDPLGEAWFTGSARSFIGADRVHPTDAGHEYLARRIAPSLQAAVERARARS